MPSNGPAEFNKWLEFTSSFIKKKLTAAAAQNSSNSKSTLAQAESSSKVNNSHNMNGNESISSSNTSTSDANSCSEALLLQNAQLQKSLDEYKNIVADTVGDSIYWSDSYEHLPIVFLFNLTWQEKVLRNLEAKVTERDSYWQAVVQSKEDEILILKNSAQSWAGKRFLSVKKNNYLVRYDAKQKSTFYPCMQCYTCRQEIFF